jgi:excisionase family DNA binding protein
VADLESIVRSIVREELERARMTAAPSVEALTAAAYAKRWSISVSTVRAAIREGRLASVKIGRAVRIPHGAEIARASDGDDLAWQRKKLRLLGKAGR